MMTLEQNRFQRILAILSIGLCDALKEGSISHEEAELLMFSPYMMRVCERIGADGRLFDLIHLGTELQSIKRLVGTDHWNETLNNVQENARSVLEQTNASDSQLEKWVNKFIGNELHSQ